MARPDKVAEVAELKDKFSNSAGAVLTEYRGLTVKALKDLRRSLGDDATYAVSKNTLTTIAAREAGLEGIEALLVGPTAIAFIDGDPVTVAKGLRDFGRLNPSLVIKGGVLDGKTLSPDEVRQMADLESREVLLAKVAGGLQGVLQQAVSLFAAPLSQAARTLAALESAAAEDPSLLAAAAPVAQEAPAQADSDPTDSGLTDSGSTDSGPTDSGPTNEEPAVEVASEPTNDELAADAAPAAEATEAAPAAEAPEAAPAADDTTVAASAAEEN